MSRACTLSTRGCCCNQLVARQGSPAANGQQGRVFAGARDTVREIVVAKSASSLSIDSDSSNNETDRIVVFFKTRPASYSAPLIFAHGIRTIAHEALPKEGDLHHLVTHLSVQRHTKPKTILKPAVVPHILSCGSLGIPRSVLTAPRFSISCTVVHDPEVAHRRDVPRQRCQSHKEMETDSVLPNSS
jgi:hypothetical protein